MSNVTILWFRRDLRLEDNPALAAAMGRGTVLPIYINDATEEYPWSAGGASRWWLHHALKDLDASLQPFGGRLQFYRGNPLEVLRQLIRVHSAKAVYWNRQYEPYRIEQDSAIKASLREDGVEVKSFNAGLLFEPWEIASLSGDPYKVFTPFSKAVLKQGLPSPVAVPLEQAEWAPGEETPQAATLEDLKLLPRISWDSGFYEKWEPTRAGALKNLKRFLTEAITGYADGRNFPDEQGTSELSPYLAFGQIGPREIAARVETERDKKGGQVYFSEILWREFAYHVLFHFPHTTDQPLQAKYADFPWEESPDDLKKWQQGQTGYPIVDAGMRQLWATGWMHNRVRMIVASLLVKHLLLPWQEGARWFWDTLVDADLASNSLGWQWAGGCGADAAPYFRIFNPIIQGKKFDTEGHYVRRWVPELGKVPAQCIHSPWEASEIQLKAWGVTLGETYPRPIIEHREGRDRALKALESLKEKQV